MKYLKIFENESDYTNYMNGDGKLILPNVSVIKSDKIKLYYKKKYPIRLYTEELEADFRRRKSDELSMELIDFYNKNCVVDNSNSYIPQEILQGKYLIDNSPIVSMYFKKNIINDAIIIELKNYPYIGGEILCLLQIVDRQGLPIGTIDVMVN